MSPKAIRSIFNQTTQGGNIFVCRVCLYDPKPAIEYPDFNDDRLTVVDGQMLCVDHAIEHTNPLRK